MAGPSAVSSYAANVAKQTLRVEKRIKVMGYPDDAIREAYAGLVDDGQGSEQELTLILTLRGVIKPQNNFQQQLNGFLNTL